MSKSTRTSVIQWEPITNNPPSKGNYLLALKAGTNRVRIGHYRGLRQGWFNLAGGSQIVTQRIGYWAHLPEPPEEQA